MKRRFPDPEAPEVLEAVAKRLSEMTDEEWLAEINRQHEGARETWRNRPTMNDLSLECDTEQHAGLARAGSESKNEDENEEAEDETRRCAGAVHGRRISERVARPRYEEDAPEGKEEEEVTIRYLGRVALRRYGIGELRWIPH